MPRILAMLVLVAAFVASRDAVQVLLSAEHNCDELATIGNSTPTEDEGCQACDQAADADDDDDVCVGNAAPLDRFDRLVTQGAVPELNGTSAPEPRLRPPV